MLQNLILGYLLLATVSSTFLGSKEELQAAKDPPRLPGISYIGVGYDAMRSIGLCETAICMYSGYRAEIFRHNFTISEKNPPFVGFNQTEYLCPRGIRCQLATSGFSEIDYAFANSTYSARDFGRKHYQSLSDDYDYDQTKLNQYTQELIDSINKYSKSIDYRYQDYGYYFVNVKSDNFELEQTFINEVKKLPDDDLAYDLQPLVREAYQSFIRRFGTHFVSQLSLGGRLLKITELSNKLKINSEIEEETLNKFCEQEYETMAAQYNDKININNSDYMNATEYTKYRSFVSKSSSRLIGGDPAADAKDWAQTVHSSIVPIEVQITGIEMLFSREFFPESSFSNINIKQILLIRSIQEYQNQSGIYPCLNNCSGRGVCQNSGVYRIGECECPINYGGKDCSILLTQ